MGPEVLLESRVGVLRLAVSVGSVREAAARSGLPARTVQRWAMLAGMDVSKSRQRSVLEPRPAGHGRRLSAADRTIVEARSRMGVSMRQIAVEIGFAPSTVSRELGRAGLRRRGKTRYDAVIAENRARAQRARPKPRKLDTNRELRQAVVDGLNSKFSPEQVAGRLPIDHPDREDMRVSPETIYQSLYVQGRGALRQELKVEKALRSGRAGRKPQSRLPRRTSRPWLDGARLAARPPEAEDRAVPGHWEGDLVVGPDNSGIVTLVERRGLFTLLGRLPGCRDSATVTDVLSTMIESLPEAVFTTITWDQGSEMAEHAKFTVATGCPVYFCDPHSPWQRPTNENTNGLIRDFYPTGTNFNEITDADLAETQRLLNIRPRAVLGFHTPSETLNSHIARVALTT
ncbi:IS30 family transposase [Microbacterium sp. MC2]